MEVSVATKDVKEQEEDENELDIVEKEKGEVLPQEAEPQVCSMCKQPASLNNLATVTYVCLFIFFLNSFKYRF